jgi:site-specific DNA recombinase
MAERAAVYCRISEDPRATAKGVGRQREDCEALVRSRGWDLVGVHVDNDISALRGAYRPAYAELLRSVERGEVDRIVAYGLSRLWRSRPERAEAIGVLSAARVGVALVKGSDLDLTSAAGRMYAGVLGEFDTAESEIKAERVARAAQQRAEEGRPNGALGYGWVRVVERDAAGRKTSARDVENVAEADVVRAIVVGLLARTSIKAITSDLNARGVPRPTAQSAAWGPSTVRKLALRSSNVGDRVHRGVVIGPGSWPALVDRVDHDRVVALLNDPRRRLSRDGARRNLLSYGIGRCGVCGSHLRVASRGGHPLYHCDASSGCVGRRVEWVDDLIRDVVVARLARPDARMFFERDDEGAREARAALDALRARLDSAADSFAGGHIDAAQLHRITARLRPELEVAQRNEQRTVRGVAPALLEDLAGPVARERWDAMDVTQRRAVLQTLGVEVVIHPARGGSSFKPHAIEVVWST